MIALLRTLAVLGLAVVQGGCSVPLEEKHGRHAVSDGAGWLIDYGQLEYLDRGGVWRRGASVLIRPCAIVAPGDPRAEDGYCLHIKNNESMLDRVRGIRPTSPLLVDWAQFQGKPMLVYSDERRRWERP